MENYIAPQYNLNGFNCPNCNAFAEQNWSLKILVRHEFTKPNGQKETGNYDFPKNFSTAKCSRCHGQSIWLDQKMIYPLTGNAPMPNLDMPDDVKNDYEEARSIVNLSSKGAAALLRLAVQRLCVHLGEKGKYINEDIKSLVKKGLPETMQQALDSVRVVGNNAVHPGQIDFDDDPETAHKLFGFINIIVDMLITQPKKIREFYDFKLPEGTKESIAKRDGKTN